MVWLKITVTLMVLMTLKAERASDPRDERAEWLRATLPEICPIHAEKLTPQLYRVGALSGFLIHSESLDRFIAAKRTEFPYAARWE